MKRVVVLVTIFSLIFIATHLADAAFDDGLILYYQFEGNADDSSGNDYHGTAFGGLNYVQGVIGQAASFDGIDDYIDTNTRIDNLTSMSVFAWVRPYAQNFTGNLYIVHNVMPNSGGFNLFITNGYPAAHLRAPSDTVGRVIDPPAVQLGEWYLWGFTWDGNVLRLYVDGVEVANDVFNQTIDISTVNVHIATSVNDPLRKFVGDVDDLRIYDRALNPAEIQALYDGLIAHYEFEGNADDSSGNDYHGTIVGSPSFVEGIFGQAINLDELSGEYVDTNQTFGGYTEFSAFVWARMDSEVITDWRSIIYADSMPSDAVGHQGGFFINVNNTGSIDTSIVGDDDTLDRLRFSWPTIGEWFFVGHTWDGSTHKAYLNGSEILSGTYNKPMGTSPETSLIGAEHYGGSITRFFDGAIDDLRIYNRVLTESEIQSLYASGTQSNEDGGGGGGG